MKPEEVEKALTSEQPSELLVKSVVSSAMVDVEEKVRRGEARRGGRFT